MRIINFLLLLFLQFSTICYVYTSKAEESFYNSIDHSIEHSPIEHSPIEHSPVSYEVIQHSPIISHETIETLPDKHHTNHIHHTECALIMNANKQYINEYTNFNHHVDGLTKRSLYDPEEEICISYAEIDQAIIDAKKKLGNFIPNELFELSSNNPKSVHIAVAAEIVEEATRTLAQRFGLPKEIILFALPKINTMKTKLKDMCPAFLLPKISCEISKYRTLTGMCNNLEYPSWGSARSAMIRLLPPNFSDGVGELRISKDHEPLPSPRLISFVVHHDLGEHSIRTTVMLTAWSQIIGHDFSLADQTLDDEQKPLKCCEDKDNFFLERHPACRPISIPKNDPFYKFFSQKCMSFSRILPALKPNCPLGPRSPINVVSSYIDGNFVYGSDLETAKRLRTMVGGRLKTTPIYPELGLKDLLPMKKTNPDQLCERSNSRQIFCFDAGDRRVNEQVPLTVLHTIFMREHNRIADQLAYFNSHLDDETIYQETRRIMIALIQHITYNEFLPVILGDKLMAKYGLNLKKEGYYEGYNSKINAGTRVAFQAAGFRFGHSMITDTVERYNKFHYKLESFRMSSLILQPFIMYKPGIIDSLILGLVNQESNRFDPQISTEVTNHLFEKPGTHFGQDLASIDVQRGREFGIPGYNYYREYCGLKKAYSFEDLAGEVDNRTIHRLSMLYKHVDDVDLFTAGLSEFPTYGSMLGPTFSCIVAEQFVIARDSDRFWYENVDSKFTLHQLSEIRKSTLAKLICDNSDDIETVQLYPFLQPDHLVNPRVNCHKLNGIDISAFIEHELPYKK